jgi:ubiquinone/menaquinone biosynthesis C-methylase UbiE
MSDDVLRVHSESAQTYDEICLQVESHAHEVLFGLAFEYINSGEALLDVGVGTGVSSKLFHKAGLAIYGVDNSEEMLAVCREKGFAKELKKHDLCALATGLSGHRAFIMPSAVAYCILCATWMFSLRKPTVS